MDKMKNRVFILNLVLPAIFLLFSFSVSAADLSDISVQSLGDVCSIASCKTTASGKLVIPGEIDGKKVTAVSQNAFNDCTYLENIELPDTVTEIGDNAFYNCASLKQFTMPDSVTKIGKTVFGNCYQLKSVRLSKQLKALPQKTFYWCSSLTEVIFGDKVETIHSNAFFNCPAIRNIVLSEGLRTISAKSFVGCESLRKVYLPERLAEVGESAFYNCSDFKIYYQGTQSAFKKINVAATNLKFYDATVEYGHIHKKNSEVTEIKATCLENGYKHYLCSCSKSFDDDFTAAKGHNLSVLNTVREPTCTKKGLAHLECERCTYYEKVSLPLKSHKTVTDKAIKADCYNPGKTEGSHCSACGKVLVAQKTVPALDHSYTKKVKDKAHLALKATYTKPAVYYYSCSRCVAISMDKTFKGEKLVLGSVVGVKTTSDSSSITITWDKVKGATGYYLYRKNSKGKFERTKNIKTNKVVVSGLSSGKVYTFAVRAYVVENKTAVNAPDYAKIKAYTAPLAPAKLNAEQSKDKIKLTWSASKGATGYVLYKYDLKTKKTTAIKKAIKNCSYTIKNLKSGTYYSYAVKAYIDTGKNIIFSKGTSSVLTCTRPESPVLKATSLKGAVRLTWNRVNGADGYIIYGSSKPDSGYKKIAVTTFNTFTKKNLISGKTYYFKAYALKKLSKSCVYSYTGEIKSVKTK